MHYSQSALSLTLIFNRDKVVSNIASFIEFYSVQIHFYIFHSFKLFIKYFCNSLEVADSVWRLPYKISLPRKKNTNISLKLCQSA